MTDQHSHLHRLVETTAMRENAVNHDHMTYLKQLAGMRPTLPSLEEASEMQNFEVGGYIDPSAAHEEDVELPEAVVSGSAPSIPDLSKWKTKIVGKGVVSRSIELQGKVVNVVERGEPKGSGLYRYTLYIDGKKIGKQDFTDTKDMFRTIKTAVVEGVESVVGEDARFSLLVRKTRFSRSTEMGEGRPYDPAEDPRRFTDKMLYDFMDMAAEVGGEDRIKLSRAAYKKYSAALREMKNRKLPVKRPPASDFDSNGMYTKAVPGAKGGVRPKMTEAAEDTEGRYSLVRHKGMVHARGQNRDWWEVMYPTKSGKLAKIATITQTSDGDEPYEVEVGTLRPEVLMQSFRAVGDAFRAAIKRWEKSHAKGESVESVDADRKLHEQTCRRYWTQSGRLMEAVLQSEALTEATVRAFLAVLSSKLTQYDEKISARERMPNVYRLGHLLGAVQRVEDRVKGMLDQSTPEALKALEAAMDREFTPKFPPVNAVKKQIAAFLDSGKMPKLK